MGVTSVTLGNFFTTSNGKTVLGGAGGSGLDTQSLVTSLVQAASVPITQDQATIKTNTSQITALSTFQSLLTNFQSAADALRNPPGVGNDASNVFASTTGSVGNGGSAYVTVTPTAGAAIQSYNISNISSVATAASQTTGVFNIASANTDATTGAVSFNPGTITFASGATITINSGDTLNTIAADFNSVSSTTGINASIIQIDSSHYQLSFTATQTGTDADFDLRSSGTVTIGSGVIANIGLTDAGTVNGTNASFEINNVPITRQTNNISDVVDGVTFNILQKTPDDSTTYPATISANTTTVQNSIDNFVTSYNALQTFASQQTAQNSDGTYASTAVLAQNQVFRQTMTSINSQILSQATGVSGSLTSLNDIGITLTNQAATATLPAVSNILSVDDTKLGTLLSTNYNDVQNLFGFNLTADNANLEVFSATKPLGVQNFTVTIAGDPGAQTFNASYTVDGNAVSVPLTATSIGNSLGYSLTGPAGSALDGLQLIYGSTANATINVTTSQGIADKVYDVANAATTATTGTIAVATTGIQSSNTTLNNDITRVTAQVNQYQTQLLAKFAALESSISKVNTLLQSLNANSDAALVASGN